MARNKLRRSLLLVLMFLTFVALLTIQAGVQFDLKLFPQGKAFATTKDGLILANLPLSKLYQHVEQSQSQNRNDKNCLPRLRPLLSQLQFSNTFWQVMNVLTNGKIYLNGAYIDTREATDSPLVRILLLSEDYINPPIITSNVYCQFWMNDNNKTLSSTVVPAFKATYLWYEDWGRWGSLHPYMVTCNIPHLPRNANTFWESVSLLWGQCSSPTNDLRLTYQVPSTSRKTFGVCVKGLSVPKEDISRNLIEWVEMLKLMGVDGIHFYVFEVHPNVLKVLTHYEQQGMVTTKPVTLAGYRGPLSTHQYINKNIAQVWKQELITYNDCFLTNMYNYRYIAVLDIDEVILPMNSEDWYGLIEDVYDGDAPSWEHSPSLCFQMRLFMNTIVDEMNPVRKISVQSSYDAVDEDMPFMMKRLDWVQPDVYSVVGYQNFKCIHPVQSALVIHNHSPRICLHSQINLVIDHCVTYVEPSLGYTHHHRKSCCEQAHFADNVNPTDLFLHDKTILRYRKQLQNKSDQVIKVVFQSL